MTQRNIEIQLCEGELIDKAMEFCKAKYNMRYETYWNERPDMLFVAQEAGEIVATCGLTFPKVNKKIPSEKYYDLDRPVETFIRNNLDKVAELGRLSSQSRFATKAILNAVISFSREKGILFLFSWANDKVARYITHGLNFNFVLLSDKLNVDKPISDEGWVSPPIKFFIREDFPKLYYLCVPFAKMEEK